MSKMSNFSLTTWIDDTIGRLAFRICLGFVVLLVLFSTTMYFMSVRVNDMQAKADHAKNKSMVSYEIAQHMKYDIVQIRQLISDISTTGESKDINGSFGKVEENYKSFISGLDNFQKIFEEGYHSQVQRDIKDIRVAVDKFYEVGKVTAQAFIDGIAENDNKYMSSFNKAERDLVKRLYPFVTGRREEMKNAMNAMASSSVLIGHMVAGCSALVVVCGILLAWVTTRSITKPVNMIISDLDESSEQVVSASIQVSAASQSLAEGATEQAAGFEETSSSLEEISAMTRQNAENAQQADSLATEAKKYVDSGSEAMKRMNVAITQIQESSNQTAKIIKVIDDIAFQTNLLALNAAVEAARAGEAGKGFAVVAEEVRNLAMRSAEAAKNTSELIEDSVKNSKNGVDIATDVSKNLEDIVVGIGKTSDLVSEIAAVSIEQAQGIDQLNFAVSQMDKVTQSNAANAEESASVSEELNAQADGMKNIVNELMRLVKGSKADSQERRAFVGDAKNDGKSKVKKSDELFHSIANDIKNTEAVKEFSLDD